ncbi:receptor-like protein kinase [Pyrus ussuriensis x Pyrus communis]|uniref:Receptor-like protein kinase n=1 Tax=Pyrus ussuriensis x Pyrus communis TaxID=2448454 RepID=A0A5N5G4Q0_9ROSA|nr:receptor-like protein kinase [Pyrus ussuriensis x Pyrus communis]
MLTLREKPRNKSPKHDDLIKSYASSFADYEECIVGFMDDLPLVFCGHEEKCLGCGERLAHLTLRSVLRGSVGVIGESKLGMTEKVVLLGGRVCAVKRFRNVSSRKREFGKKIEHLAKVSQKCEYLLPVIAYLYAKRIKFVLSDYKPMGSLADLLAGARQHGHTALEWNQRLTIVNHIAQAIAFIHGQYPPYEKKMKINVHGSIRPCNVMVNVDFSACLSDYGFTQLAQPVESSSTWQLMKSPSRQMENNFCDELSQKSDIYNFGLILLDILAEPMGLEMTRGINEKQANMNLEGGLEFFDFPVKERKERRQVSMVLQIALASTGWVNRVNAKLGFTNQCTILKRAKVQDAMFLTKRQVVHVESDFLWHVVTRLAFSHYREHTFHHRVIPLALEIGQGHIVLLAPLFLGLLYCELDKIHTLEEQVTDDAPIKSFLCVGFLQIFLWKKIRGLNISLNLSKAAKSCFVIDLSSYMFEKLLLACCWFRKVPGKMRDFLELLDDVNGKGMFSKQSEKVASCMLLIKTPFAFLYLLGLCFKNLVFCDLSGKVKHLRPKEFVTFGIPREPKSKSSWAFALSGAPKHSGYLDTSISSENDWSTSDAADENESSKDLEATENSNSSVIGDYNFDEVDVFLNDDVRVNIACSLIVTSVAAVMTVKVNVDGPDVVIPLSMQVESVEADVFLVNGETFISCVDFKCVMVYSGLLNVLGMFFETVRNVDGNLRHLSPYLCGRVLEELKVLLLDMEHVPCLELTEHKMLCWHDIISDLAALGMPIKSLAERLEKLHDTMFSLRLEKDKGILRQFAKVREIERAFELKHKELEHEKSKLKKMCHGSSKETANCLHLMADQMQATASSVHWKSSPLWSIFCFSQAMYITWLSVVLYPCFPFLGGA